MKTNLCLFFKATKYHFSARLKSHEAAQQTGSIPPNIPYQRALQWQELEAETMDT